MFAVVRVGGAVTTSDSYYALPWSVLSYQEAKGGYVVPFSKDQIVRGPGVSIFDLTEVDGADRRVEAYSHYEVAKDW